MCISCREYKTSEDFNLFRGQLNVRSPRCKDCVFKAQSAIMKNPVKKEYVLYLHPHARSAQYQSLSQYWRNAKLLVASGLPNSAVDFPFHFPLSEVFETTDPLAIRDKACQFVFAVFAHNGVANRVTFKFVEGDCWVEIISNKLNQLMGWLAREFPFIPAKLPFKMALLTDVGQENTKKFKEQLHLLEPGEWTDRWTIILWEVREGRVLEKTVVICHI